MVVQKLLFRDCAADLSKESLSEYFNENLYDDFGICIAEMNRSQYNNEVATIEL